MSEPSAPAHLQRVLDKLVADGAPAALAQLCQGRGTWQLASGVAELGTERSVEAGGWFRIGSVTKTFTATVILQLVGEGKLGLDDTVQRWLPDLVPGGANITVRQLLNHTSGLYNYTRDFTADAILRDRLRRWTPREVVALALRHEPEFHPGTSRAYNNTAFILLGMVIERIAGFPYGEQIEKRILQPLGLSQTSAADESELLPQPHAHGYLAVDGRPIDITTYHPSQAGAAGGMISTAADLNRFFAELLSGGLLGPAELREMLTTMPTGTPGVEGGLGIGRYELPNGVSVWGKDGGFYGYHTWSFHAVDATCRLTVSTTVALTGWPTTPDFLASVAEVFAA